MSSWPPEFIERTKKILGNEFPLFLVSLDQPAPTSVRLNPAKRISQFDKFEKISWTSDAYYLPERPSFTLDPFFHAGCYYVQDASSMFIEQLVKPVFTKAHGLKVLDLCAAPGGKSTHLLSLLPAGSILVCNEIIPKRNAILRQNLVKWGHANVLVTQNKIQDFEFLENYFDLVLVDTPCSGEGLFRRNPEAAKEWSTEAVDHCTSRQKEILQTAIICLRPNGTLIYSTCTFEASENEDQVEWMKKKFGLEVRNLSASMDGIVVSENGCRFYPHRLKGEGLFISSLTKIENEGGDGFAPRGNKTTSSFGDSPSSQHLREFLSKPDEFREIRKEDRLYALPSELIGAYFNLENKLFIRMAGIFMGKIAGKELIPSHDLALSLHARKDLSCAELDKEESIRYLRCESIHPGNLKQGWTLVRYEGHNLGFLKILQGRSNNYFPKEFRVLKDLPTE